MHPQTRYELAKTAAVAVVLAVYVGSIAACSPGQLSQALTAADAIGRGIADVANWADAHGIEPETVLSTAKALAAKDYITAAQLTAQMLAEAQRRGVDVPVEIRDRQELVQAAAAYSIEQGLRALSGRNPDGSPKP